MGRSIDYLLPSIIDQIFSVQIRQNTCEQWKNERRIILTDVQFLNSTTTTMDKILLQNDLVVREP